MSAVLQCVLFFSRSLADCAGWPDECNGCTRVVEPAFDYICRHCHTNRDSDEPDYGSCEHSWERFDYDPQDDDAGYEGRKAERDRIARLSNAGICIDCERVWAECECPLPF